jgi:hypothetical protein
MACGLCPKEPALIFSLMRKRRAAPKTVLLSKSIGHEAYADEGDDEAELIEK